MNGAPTGLRNFLNNLRGKAEEDGLLYAKRVPVIDATTTIGDFGAPILNPDEGEVLNQFVGLLRRIFYTQVRDKLYRNPLKVLEGEQMPLGYAGQEIMNNPVEGRHFNVDDFAGLLKKYEGDVKQQFFEVNSDLQYPLTITRAKIKDAFVSWETLNNFVNAQSNSLYNGAYIDEYNLTKGLVSSAYQNNRVNMEVINAVTTKATAEAFTIKAREMFLNFQAPSTKFNAWARLGGYGRPVTTWSNPEDIVLLVRSDVRAVLDVDVLANAFNMDKADLMGRIITIDSFDVLDRNGEVSIDGSNIIAGMFDASWFRIKQQEIAMDEFYNANNRTWQLYLNVVKMYNYSLFANAVLFVSAKPEIAIEGLTLPETMELQAGERKYMTVAVNPINGNNPAIEFTSSDTAVATVEASDNNPNAFIVRALTAGTSTITATSGEVSDTMTLTVE